MLIMARKSKKYSGPTKCSKKSLSPNLPSRRKSVRLNKAMNELTDKVKQFMGKNVSSIPAKTEVKNVRKVGNVRKKIKTDNLVTIIDENVLNEDFIPLSSTDVGTESDELKCSKLAVDKAICNAGLQCEIVPTIVIDDDDDEEEDLIRVVPSESEHEGVNDSIQIIGVNASTNCKKRKHDESIEICFEASDRNSNIAKKSKVEPSCSKSDIEVQKDIAICENNKDADSDDEIVVIESSKNNDTITVLKDIPQQNNSVFFGRKKDRRKRHINFVKETVPSHSLIIEDSQGTSNNKSAKYKSPLTCSSDMSYFNKTGNNIYNPNNVKKTGLRPVIIDGCNVAYGHGGNVFSTRGVEICVNYFVKRGHMVRAFIPRFRRNEVPDSDRKILDELHGKQLLCFTPSRYLHGRCVASYDDRFIVQCAAELGGVIVSTDNYRDLLGENESWKETIEKRLLMFTWVGDILMFPDDPNGRHGPRLEEFLRFPE